MDKNQNLSILIDKVVVDFGRLMDDRRKDNIMGFSAYVNKPERYLYTYRKIETLLELTRKYHKKGSLILDAGCGAGIPLIVSTYFVGNVVGFDVNPTAMNILKRYIGIHGIDAMNFVGSMIRVPIKPMSADIVWCLDVLEHLEDPEQAVLEAKRILKPNGHMIISLPVENYLTRVFKKMMRLGAKAHYTGSVKSFSAMFEILCKHFYLLEIETIPDWLPLTFAYGAFAVFLNQTG